MSGDVEVGPLIVVASTVFFSQHFAHELFMSSLALDWLFRAALAEFLSTDDTHIELALPTMFDGVGRRLTPEAGTLGTPSLAFRVFAEGTLAYINTVTLLREAHRPEHIARFEALIQPRLHGLGMNSSSLSATVGFGQPPTCPCPGRAGRDRACGLTRCVRCEANEIGGELGICAVCGDGKHPAGNQCVPCSPDSAGAYGICTRCPPWQQPNIGRTNCEEASHPSVATAAVGSMSAVSLCLSGVILCVIIRRRRAQRNFSDKRKALGSEAEELANMIGAAVVAATPPTGQRPWHSSDQADLAESIRPRALEYPIESPSCSESEAADVADVEHLPASFGSAAGASPRSSMQFAELRVSGVESPRGTARPEFLHLEPVRSPRPLTLEPSAWNSCPPPVQLDIGDGEPSLIPRAGFAPERLSPRISRSPRSPASSTSRPFCASAEELEITVPEPPHASVRYRAPWGGSPPKLFSPAHSRTPRSPRSPRSPCSPQSTRPEWQARGCPPLELEMSVPEPPRASIRARAGGCVPLHRGVCTVPARLSPCV